MYESDETSDDGKRKRGEREEGEEEGFIRSKKTARTPAKVKLNKQKMEEKDELKEMIKELLRENKKKAKETEEIKNMLGEMAQEIKEFRKENKEYKEQMEELRRENKVVMEEMNTMKQKMEKMESCLEKCQKEEKKNNLLIKGLEMNIKGGEELREGVQNFVKSELGIEVEVVNTRKINDKTCVIEMKTFEEKLKILQNKKKLKNMKDQKIYIECDYTEREMEMQKIIRTRAAEEKKNGRIVKIGYGFLVIDGSKWKWNRDRKELERDVLGRGVYRTKN